MLQWVMKETDVSTCSFPLKGKVISCKNHTEKLSPESLWVPAMWESWEVNLYCSVSHWAKEVAEFSGSFILVSSCYNLQQRTIYFLSLCYETAPYTGLWKDRTSRVYFKHQYRARQSTTSELVRCFTTEASKKPTEPESLNDQRGH